MDGKGTTAADASLPKSGGRGRKAGKPVSDAQRKANEKARKAAQESKRKSKEARALMREEPGYKPRWQQLVDGDISVADLTLKELQKHACANDDGTWVGRRHSLPSRIVSAMDAERIRRERYRMSRLTTKAFKALDSRLEDDESPAQQLTAALRVIEYSIGKVPEVVHIGAETAYDRLQQSAFIVQRGNDLASELEQMADEEPPGLDNTGHQVVPGQLEEKEA